jgi:4-alpha-glucanotransferase
VQYDNYPRKSLIDHFFSDDATLEEVRQGRATEHGDFVLTPYEARIRRDPDRIQVQLSRQGLVDGHPVKVTKGITLHAGSAIVQVGYLLEGLPSDRALHFGVEWNIAGLPSGADDRYFHRGDGQRLGQLGTSLDLHDEHELGLSDEWLGIDVRLSANRPTHIWAFPIETVSQSEGGFELVHQSVALVPHWQVQGDAEGRWSVMMELAIDTSLAESRLDEVEHIAAS